MEAAFNVSLNLSLSSQANSSDADALLEQSSPSNQQSPSGWLYRWEAVDGLHLGYNAFFVYSGMIYEDLG
ncbi:MAG: hypothetical protein IBX50_19295 [Marinospirillum sp.]|uniref:hypothetical protein n=1 Tax=Marinospirillum sp. TaxID=2183934 RepID=UPI001A045985|nr:hypothetical protein [Marinospirillum sp.]MBE0508836.1 hypothetical protein [Marinospirillum sp.]